MPHSPLTPCTEIAPTGSSMRNRRSMKKTAAHTSTPATPPISTAEGAVTKAHGAVMATRPASVPFASIEGSGLPYLIHMYTIAVMPPAAQVRARERRPGVEAEPPEGENERPGERHRDVVTGDRVGAAVVVVLAAARTQQRGGEERHHPARHVHHGRSREIDMAVAEPQVLAEHLQPAAAPRPGRVPGINERTDEYAEEEAREERSQFRQR